MRLEALALGRLEAAVEERVDQRILRRAHVLEQRRIGDVAVLERRGAGGVQITKQIPADLRRHDVKGHRPSVAGRRREAGRRPRRL